MTDYLQKAKDYWREHGYSQGAVKSIAYFMEEIENLRIEGERQYRQIRELEDEKRRLDWDDGPGWGPGV